MTGPSSISINIPVTNKPRIVIVGGGFGGIQLAKRLKGEDVQVVMIDKNNYHTFQPLLYQVATAGLEPDSIAYPLRKIFKKQENFIFRMAEAIKVDPARKVLETSIGEIPYDFLVLATGSVTNFYGMRDMERNAMPMKSVPQSLDLRSLILQNLEAALLTTDLKNLEGLLTFVVVGGGPTGVETAGALGELKNHILPLDYPELDIKKMRIHVVDHGPRLLQGMSPSASQKAEEFLRKFEVEIWLNTGVVAYDGTTLSLSNGKTLLTKAVIWAAGVAGAVLPGLRAESVTNGRRLKVDAFSRVEGYENIFAIGDLACMVTKDSPQGHSLLAPVAMQQGKWLAQNLGRLLRKQPLRPFHYLNLGVMATIGRNQAVADLPLVKVQGVLGWFLWVFIHLMTLVGFRNRMVTFVNWVFSYLSYDKGIRLIIRPFKRGQSPVDR